MTAPDGVQYFEDFAVGQRFPAGRVRIDAEAIKAFAKQYDPQPFHIDEAAARGTFFGTLVASGWHTAALTMRLIADGPLNPVNGILGGRLEELLWPRPVYPGDELSVESEVLELRPSRSKPDRGVVLVRHTTRNQNGETVFQYVGNLLVMRRPA